MGNSHASSRDSVDKQTSSAAVAGADSPRFTRFIKRHVLLKSCSSNSLQTVVRPKHNSSKPAKRGVRYSSPTLRPADASGGKSLSTNVSPLNKVRIKLRSIRRQPSELCMSCSTPLLDKAATVKPPLLSSCALSSQSSQASSIQVINAFKLSELQVRQVQRIWATVRGKGGTAAAEAVFTSVFTRDPSIRFMIVEKGEMSAISAKLYVPWTATMDYIIETLDRPEQVAHRLFELGARHTMLRALGFHPHYFSLFGECMTQLSMQWGTKRQRNNLTQEAWTKVVMFIVHHLREGYHAQLRRGFSAKNQPKSECAPVSRNMCAAHPKLSKQERCMSVVSESPSCVNNASSSSL